MSNHRGVMIPVHGKPVGLTICFYEIDMLILH